MKFWKLGLLVLSVLSLNAFAEDHTRENLVRSPSNANETARFKLSKDIYRTETAYQNVCRDEPYYETETYQEYEYVPNQQWECTANPDGTQNCQYVDKGGYQWVTKTRQITKWHNVCRDEPYEYLAYDHTWEYAVVVTFPPEATLREGEQEKISFSMGGSEKKPKVSLDQSRTIFNYVIQSSTFANGTLNVVLATKPFLSAKDVGAKNIGSAFLEFGEERAILRVEDKFSRLRVTTGYKAIITERKSNVVLAETNWFVREGEYVKANLPVALDSAKDYELTLLVRRTGIMLTPETVEFTVKKTVRAEALDMHALKSASELDHFRINGVKEATVIGFRDGTKDYKTASTTYKVELFASRNKEKILIGSGEFARSSLKIKDRNFQLGLKDDLKVSAENLALLVRKVKLEVRVTAVRTSKRFATISVVKNASLQVRK